MSTKDTDLLRTVIVARALEIAAYPGVRKNKHAYTAYVPWHYIESLRQTFEEAGIDWRAYKAKAAAAAKAGRPS